VEPAATAAVRKKTPPKRMAATTKARKEEPPGRMALVSAPAEKGRSARMSLARKGEAAIRCCRRFEVVS
jgi:hypothetical protein